MKKQKLIHKGSKKPVQVGDRVKTFRGEEVTVVAILEPGHAGSTGRIRVKYDELDRHPSPNRSAEREFFPSVIGAEWVDE